MSVFFFNDTATTEIYTLSLHDALPISVYEGKIGSLRRFKDDAKEVQQGYECGIGIENFNDMKLGDVLEAYMLEEVATKL